MVILVVAHVLLLELLQGVLHLHFLFCLISSVFHEVRILVQLQVPHIPQQDVLSWVFVKFHHHLILGQFPRICGYI